MGYVLVRYDRMRGVYVDGEWNGYTNDTLRVGNGIHDFDLGEPDNVSPSSWRKVVKATHSIQRPLELTFVRDDA